MAMCTRLIGQQGWAAGSNIGVRVADAILIVRGEVVANGKSGAVEFEDGVDIVVASEGGVEGAVAGGHIDIALGVGGRSGVAQPDASFASIGIHIKNGLLRQGLRIVSHYPAVIG